MKKGNVFWGLIFILAAVVVIVNALGIGIDVDFWNIAFTIILVACFIKSIATKNITGVLFSIAFLLIIYDEVLHIEELTPWPVLLAALLGSIGFSIMIGDRKKYPEHDEQYFAAGENISGSDMEVNVTFGATVKNVTSDDFKMMKANCTFGAMTINLQDAMIQGDSAVLHIQVLFGGAELYIPKEWRVVNQISANLGGITEKNHSVGTSEKQLVLTGDATFSGVDIFYV